MEHPHKDSPSKTISKTSILEKLDFGEDAFNDYEYPRVSILIPTYNCSHSITATLDSILDQEYYDFEIVIIDGASTDRTLEVVKSYRNDKIRVMSYSSNNRYEKINKGISYSRGKYINILFPGDFYLYNKTLKYMMTLALQNKMPHLIYCGTLLRDGKSEVKILYRDLTIGLLSKGQQPTTLQSFWFKEDTFAAIGKFDPLLVMRGGYDLLCRFMQREGMHFVSSNRVLTDYDLRWVTKDMVVIHFKETFWTIKKYFGVLAVIGWLFKQKDISRYMKLWWRSVTIAFLGRT